MAKRHYTKEEWKPVVGLETYMIDHSWFILLLMIILGIAVFVLSKEINR